MPHPHKMPSAVDWRMADLNQIIGLVRERNQLAQDNAFLPPLAQAAETLHETVQMFLLGDKNLDSVIEAQSALAKHLQAWRRLQKEHKKPNTPTSSRP
ncbi:MAG: hypothetical protein C7B46_20750 [Sulfobacillus benefaciens]|uniref:Uncharacterized protein n=1 Tax=Sulfobacillus benefaciens TaxID=453960 RepID=A0A2T2WSF0_9FIRM|nr:MAG: hypothetical protein C7B46_20750 [Sulfobacillus benefaciens]